MKKVILTIVFLTATLNFSHAQWIQSITVLPANPTPNDTITVLAECQFPSGNCDQHTQYFFVNGNTIDAGALHCLGVLSIICDHTDTIVIPPLAAGNYTFRFQLDAGQGQSPCTPGIIPGPNDSINFVVSSTTNLDEFVSQDLIKAVPNPSKNFFVFEGLDVIDYPVRTEVYSVNGKLVMQQIIRQPNQQFDISQLASGMYQLKLFCKSDKNYFVSILKE